MGPIDASHTTALASRGGAIYGRRWMAGGGVLLDQLVCCSMDGELHVERQDAVHKQLWRQFPLWAAGACPSTAWHLGAGTPAAVPLNPSPYSSIPGPAAVACQKIAPQIGGSAARVVPARRATAERDGRRGGRRGCLAFPGPALPRRREQTAARAQPRMQRRCLWIFRPTC